MFERLVTAIEPFALTIVVISGLVLSGRVQVADRGIIGMVTVFIGVALIVIHIFKEVKNTNTNVPSKKGNKVA
jgi:hypothetical protein